MSFWTPENVRASCGGAWLARPRGGSSSDRPISGLSTDSRALRPGQVFLALKGERFDGHEYLAGALSSGAALLIVDDAAAGQAVAPQAVEAGIGIVRVPDTGKALLRLAAAYRRTLENTKVVAVGGSNGKTTTTRLIHAVLASALRGTASAKSFNNAVGVPLTILSAAPNDQFLICEIGTNAPGEIAQLASVIEPDIAVITSIGREHLEGFGTIQGVAREEAALLSFLRPGGLAVITADTPVEAPLTEYLKGLTNIVRFGFSPEADLRASDVHHEVSASDGSFGLRFRINSRTECRLPMLGEHNAANALAAWAVGRRLGLEPTKIIHALSGAKGPEMRLEPVTVTTPRDPIIFINDAYNANPDSMLASLHTFADIAESMPAETAPRRRIVVLGDMLELGAAAESSHREVGQRVAAVPALSAVAFVGEQMNMWAVPALAGGPVRVIAEPGSDADAVQRLAGQIEPGDLVLLKGSRRMRLERIVEAVRQRWSAGVPHTVVAKGMASGEAGAARKSAIGS